MADARLLHLLWTRVTRLCACPVAPDHHRFVPLLTLDHISHAYGHLPLLDDVAVTEPRERVSIIGRNGTGKTLLVIISGEIQPDAGNCLASAGATGASPGSCRTCHGLRLCTSSRSSPKDSAGLRDMTPTTGVASTRSILQACGSILGRRGAGHAVWRLATPRLLGGSARQNPMLLLDEPTNHLDIDAIRGSRTSWLNTQAPSSS